MAQRKLTLVLAKIVGGNYQPDTGKTVTLRNATTDALITTAVEDPAGSAQYKATWNPTPAHAYWWVGAAKQDHLGLIWSGADGQARPVYMFKRVQITGTIGAAQTLTSGQAPLVTDEDGTDMTGVNFTKTPLVFVDVGNYQERNVFKASTPGLSSGKVTLDVAADDLGKNHADGNVYADIIIISLD